jgi:predicted LPLAT superfamily acyltransferase
MNKSASRRALVVVPTYNNASTLGEVIASLVAQGLPVLVVDDGSTDDTPHILAKSEAAHLRHAANRGKGAAILTGFRYAASQGYDDLVVFDADGQFQASEVQKLLLAAAAHPGALVIGERSWDAKGSGDIPSSSRFGCRFSNFWVKIETGLTLSDTQSGLRLYPVDARLYANLSRTRYDFEIEILVKALWQGFSVRTTPVMVYYPPREERVSHFRGFVDNARLTRLHTLLVTRRLFDLVFGLTPKPEPGPRERRGLNLLVLFYRLGGPWFCYLFAVFPLFYYFVTGAKARRGIGALHRRLANQEGRFWLASFKNYLFFAFSLIDRMTAARLRAACPRPDREPVEALEDVVVTPRSIFIGAHYGDWLLCALTLARSQGIRMQLIIDTKQTPKFQRLIAEAGLDPASIGIIEADAPGLDLVLKIKEVIDRGDCLCLMGDRLMHQGEPLTARFLGAEAALPRGPFELARIFGPHVYFFSSTKSGWRPTAPYKMHIHKMSDQGAKTSAAAIAQAYAGFIEQMVRKQPHHWFNFFDFWEQRWQQKT